ncbi:hypothetical protein MBLNU459_g4932t1 [Dothideomycetes sp. NU459]
MQYSIAFAALVATTQASVLPSDTFYGALLPRQSAEDTYIASVCVPDITSPVPPCQEIINIEEQCQPNGTEAIDYIAHQECMCGGSFFSNWNGCLNCEYVHGSRSEAEAEAYSSIISTASNMLCTGTPTASFAAIFSSVSEASPQTVSGAATVLSDQYPSQSAVSLYYTATGAQGAGAITGSAAEATASATGSSRTATESSSGSSSGSIAVLTSVASTGSVKSVSASQTSSAASKSSGSSSGSATASAATTSATQKGAASGNKVLGGMAVIVAMGLVVVL